MMSHSDIRDRLDDYVDGSLPGAERETVETHLAGCDACRGEIDATRRLLVDARSLPRGVTPPRDLWPGIAERIERGKVVEVDFRSRIRRNPRLSYRVLAAAAVMLVIATSTITALLVRSPAGPPIATRPPGTSPLGTDASSGEVVTALAAFRPAEREYIRTADDLAAILEAQRDVLAPETVAVLEENLRIIDRAIAESRAALEADPNNRILTEMLSDAYRQKVDLLQSAVLLQVEA